ncbi:MAG: PcfB family protein [Defluviitaleaceae bacterium]|nr:PcfB family protein [Defluviitaleaceae bacterium]
MSTAGDAAQQVVHFYFEGMEYVLKLAGAGAKHLAAMIVAALQDNGKSQQSQMKLMGKERLANMLKSGQPLKIFAIQNKDLPQFAKEAKRYGVVYNALREKNGKPDSLVDIMARADDAPKISRIMERLQFATVDRATIEGKLAEREAPDRDDTDKLLDQLLDDGKVKPDEPVVEAAKAQAENPTAARTDSGAPSESRSRTQSESAENIRGTNKPESVRDFLRERTAQNKKKEEPQPDLAAPEVKPNPIRRQPVQHRQPPSRGKSKSDKNRSR